MKNRGERLNSVKRLVEIDTSKYTNALCREAGVDAVILDIEKVESKSIYDIQGVPVILKEVIGAKLIFIEPIGDGSDLLAGMILYFMLSNGDQRAIEIDPDPFYHEDTISIQFYKLDKQK